MKTLHSIQHHDNFRFAASVAEFGMLLRNSEYKGNADFSSVKQTAQSAIENDEEGYKKEFISLVKKASSLKQKETASIEEMMMNKVVIKKPRFKTRLYLNIQL